MHAYELNKCQSPSMPARTTGKQFERLNILSCAQTCNADPFVLLVLTLAAPQDQKVVSCRIHIVYIAMDMRDEKEQMS